MGAGLQATGLHRQHRVVSRALPYPYLHPGACGLRGHVGRGRPVGGHVLGPGALALHGGCEGRRGLVGRRAGILIPQGRILSHGVLVQGSGLGHALVGVLGRGEGGFLLLQDQWHAGGGRGLGVVQLVRKDDGHPLLDEGGLVLQGELALPLLAVADHGNDARDEQDGRHHHGRDDRVQVHIVLAALLGVPVWHLRGWCLRGHPPGWRHWDKLEMPAAARARHCDAHGLEVRLQCVDEGGSRLPVILSDPPAQRRDLLLGAGLQGQGIVGPLHHDGAPGDVLQGDGTAVAVPKGKGQLLHQGDLLVNVVCHGCRVTCQLSLEACRGLVPLRAPVDVDLKGIHRRQAPLVRGVHEVLVLAHVAAVWQAIHELAVAVELHPRLLAYQLLLPKLQGQLQLISGGVLIVVEGIRWDLHLKVGADPGVHPVDVVLELWTLVGFPSVGYPAGGGADARRRGGSFQSGDGCLGGDPGHRSGCPRLLGWPSSGGGRGVSRRCGWSGRGHSWLLGGHRRRGDDCCGLHVTRNGHCWADLAGNCGASF